jgi:tripartite-type tricarboxylate transporter receptor subunit TctC
MGNPTGNFRAKGVILAALLAPAALFGATTADAETYPSRPITVIVPFAGGSASDVVTRIVLNRMSKSMGQPIVVENRAGAGGNTGTAAGAKSPADGYAWTASGSGPLSVNMTLYRALGYDTEKDFQAISPFASFTIVVVASTKLPVNTLGELIAYAKERPGQLNYGSVGIGSSQHLGGVYFEMVTGVKLTHVPYRNIMQYGPDMIAGTVPLGFNWLPNVASALSSGGAKALAVAGKSRLPALPDTPTTAEAGLPAYEASGWFALMVPRNTPKEIVARINRELADAIADPVVRERFQQQGAEPMAMSPEDAAKFISADIAKWRDIISKAGIPLIQ